MAKVDLSEFLPKKGVDLSEFLNGPTAPPEPTEVLSPPEMLTLHWLRQTCSCGRAYTAQEHQPTIRHTIFRRQGFGLHTLGKVYIPMIAGLDVSDLPQEVIYRDEVIFECPSCAGHRASQPLFPDEQPDFIVSPGGSAMSPHAARWHDMHKTSRQSDLDETLKGMHRRGDNFDDLLGFKTTKLDLQSVAQQLCDPENIQ